MPVIAAIHGVAFGGGFQLALGADMRFLSPDARMSIMEIKWGLVPDMAGTPILASLVRDDILRELTYTGRIFSAQEALSYGLATRICDDPRAAAFEMAREIAGKSPDAIRAAKRLLNNLSVDPGPALLAESVEQMKLMGAPNQLEAVRANMEKRPPRFADVYGRNRHAGSASRPARFAKARSSVSAAQARCARSVADNEAEHDRKPSLFLGIISGQRRRSHAEVAGRVDRIAGGLQTTRRRAGRQRLHADAQRHRLHRGGLRGDAARRLRGAGQLAFQAGGDRLHPEGFRHAVLIGHADLLHQMREAIPAGITVLSVPTPPEILASYKIDPDHLAAPDFAIDLESWLERQPPYDGPALPQPQNMIYTSGTTGHPKGVRRNAPTPEQSASSERCGR